ncbi:MAG: hypothetical protein ACN4GZ_15835 [Acidimicrobiales bacterium]
MRMNRRRFAGTWSIIWFNWDQFLAGVVAITGAFLVAAQTRGLTRRLFLAAGIAGTTVMANALMPSHLVYDRSGGGGRLFGRKS